MISERQKTILWSIIEEHTKAAEPVSSKSLAQKSGFDIGAPMIRKEMSQLENEGYLAQPHTSAGRIPTDKAYRLYIQEQMNKTNIDSKANNHIGLSPKETQKINGSLNKKWSDSQSLLKEVSKIASDISKELSVSGRLGGENSFMCGFSNLFDEPELRSFDNMNQIMRFMDNIDSYFDSIWDKILCDDMKVFIGNENPIKEINEFTLITGKYQLPEGEQGFVSVIGPKRMNYKRNMALVDYISKIINDK
jgi:transcriptional regulator of heat shock response